MTDNGEWQIMRIGRQWGNNRQWVKPDNGGITDNGESQTMGNDRQYGMADNGGIIDNGERQIMGNDREWSMTDSGEKKTMGNDRRWGMTDQGNDRPLGITDHVCWNIFEINVSKLWYVPWETDNNMLIHIALIMDLEFVFT